MSAGETPAVPAIIGWRGPLPDTGRIKIYDFRRPDKFTRDQIRTIQLISETWGNLAMTRLSSSLRLLCELRLELVDQMTWREFIEPLAGPRTLAVVAMDGLPGPALIHVDAAATDAALERMFGATPAATATPLACGGISDIEYASLERLLAGLAKDLAPAWHFVQGLAPRLSQIETDPKFCQIVPPEHMIVTVGYSLSVGGVDGRLDLAFPFMTLEPVVRMLSAEYWYAEQAAAGSTPPLDAAFRVPVPAELAVDAGRLTVDFLRRLRKGVAIPLPSLDRGRAWLSLGDTRVAELSSLERDGRGWKARFADGGDYRGSPGAEAGSAQALAAELKAELGSLKEGLGSAVAGLAATVAELKGAQEDLSDRVAYGQADAEPGAAGRPFSSLAGMRAEPMALFLASERPQVTALVLSFLEDAQAARLLSLLPEPLRPEVTRRVALSDCVVPDVAATTEKVLYKKLSAMEKDRLEPGGLAKAVGILNAAPRATEKLVVEGLMVSDPRLAEDIKKNMFVFEDIAILDDESVAAVLSAADERDILVAMKPVPEALRERLFSRFPEARRERAKAAFAELGRVRLSEADAAGQRVVAVIRELEERGQIGVERAGD